MGYLDVFCTLLGDLKSRVKKSIKKRIDLRILMNEKKMKKGQKWEDELLFAKFEKYKNMIFSQKKSLLYL